MKYIIALKNNKKNNPFVIPIFKNNFRKNVECNL